MGTMSAFLAERRAKVERTQTDPSAHAIALVELAEAEPLFGSRFAPVQAAIEAAAPQLDAHGTPELRGRLMLRLAALKLASQELDAADRALGLVVQHAPDHVALGYGAGVRGCRVAIRRGPAQRRTALDLLLTTAARLPDLAEDDPLWQRVTADAILGVAEIELHADPPSDAPFEPLRELVAQLAGDPAHAETVFAGHQLLAAYAMSIGERASAITSLRLALELATSAAAYADECEARLTLTALLVDSGELVSLQEAAHHAQRARDRALEHGLTSLFQAALVAQAGVMSVTGKTGGAIDRMLELARSAVTEKDLPRYIAAVGMMAELYAKSGDVASAFRTIAEAHHALSAATGQDMTSAFVPHLAALRERVGDERLAQIAADAGRANQLAAELTPRTPSDSG